MNRTLERKFLCKIKTLVPFRLFRCLFKFIWESGPWFQERIHEVNFWESSWLDLKSLPFFLKLSFVSRDLFFGEILFLCLRFHLISKAEEVGANMMVTFSHQRNTIYLHCSTNDKSPHLKCFEIKSHFGQLLRNVNFLEISRLVFFFALYQQDLKSSFFMLCFFIFFGVLLLSMCCFLTRNLGFSSIRYRNQHLLN